MTLVHLMFCKPFTETRHGIYLTKKLDEYQNKRRGSTNNTHKTILECNIKMHLMLVSTNSHFLKFSYREIFISTVEVWHQQSMYKNRAIDSTVVTKRTLFPQLRRNWKPNTNSAVLNIGLRQWFSILSQFVKDATLAIVVNREYQKYSLSISWF